MVLRNGYTEDETLLFRGKAWVAPSGQFVLASGNCDNGFSARTQILYRDGLVRWQADVPADANEGAVTDEGLCLLSYVRDNKGCIMLIDAGGKLLVNQNLEAYATLPTIGAAGAVVAWWSGGVITVARVQKWFELAHHPCLQVPDRIELDELKRLLVVTATSEPQRTFRF
jgi:hypothetical protein